MNDNSLTGGDFFARIAQFASNMEPMYLAAMFLVMLVVSGLALFGGRRWLFLVLLLSLTLSASVWTQLDIGAALVRWAALAALALTAVKARQLPGWPWLLMTGFVGIGVIWLLFTETFIFSLQATGALILVALATAAIADYSKDLDAMSQIFKMAIVAAVVWTVLAVISLPEILAYRMYATRFSGASGSVTVFAATGGFLLPIVVWGAMRRTAWTWRAACGCMAALMVALLFVSAQRAGTLAGIIGCTPLLLTGNIRRTMLVGAVVAMSLGMTYILFLESPDQILYAFSRYTESGLNTRDVIWREAIKVCLESPVIGAGHGASLAMVTLADVDMTFSRHNPHNAFLAIWYNTGIFGLILACSAIAIASWQAFRMAAKPLNENAGLHARLLLGLMMMLTAHGMVTGGFSNPSTLPTVGIFLTLALIGRLRAMSVAGDAPMLVYAYLPVAPRTTPSLST